MNIAILGTRGIPNHYGGFEQFAEYLSTGLIKLGHNVTVYNPHNHPFKKSKYKGVYIKKIFDPEYLIGTSGQFFYDFLCILNTRKIKYDLILHLGYTSSSIFFKLHKSQTIIVTNMDGMEWKRTKYNKVIKLFLRYAEKLAVNNSNYLISDSIGIQDYILKKYSKKSEFIPYGTFIIKDFNEDACLKYDLVKYNYDMLVARLEPENSIEVILEGVSKSTSHRKFIVIGNTKNKYGKFLRQKFKGNKKIKFLDGIYDQNILNNLRFYSNLYFHGHTVGGTNPSLLEAMGSGALICANDNKFNRAILGKDSFYFNCPDEVKNITNSIIKSNFKSYINNNTDKLKKLYKWENIILRYNHYMQECFKNSG